MAAPATSVSVNLNSLDAILSASPVVQLTLLCLVGLSISCWAIGIFKWKQLKELTSQNGIFLDRFWQASSLDKVAEESEAMAKHSGVARVFRAGYQELTRLASSVKEGEGKIQLSGSDNLERSLRKAIDTELANMESRLTLLATTGSTGPFIGLFGTVWGIMGSFHKIGISGSASLAVVAPGISEALIATAVGLAAAIPAVILYNHFVARIRRAEMELNNFATDFMNIAKRNFFRE